MYKSKRTSELLQEIEANEAPANGGNMKWEYFSKLWMQQVTFQHYFSMKSLAAAGKFKNRRYRENNQKKTVSFWCLY